MVRYHNTSNRRTAKYRCRVCSSYHALKTCPKFLDMAPEARWNVIRANGYCVNCLAHEHSQGICRSAEGCKKCRKPHHTLLHRASPPRRQSTSRQRQTSAATFPLMPTAELLLYHRGTYHPIRALIDVCSARSRIELKTAQKLKISSTTVDRREEVELQLSARTNKDVNFAIKAVVDDRSYAPTPSREAPQSVRQHFIRLNMADEKFHSPAPIQLILGNEIVTKIMLPEVKIESGMPMAQKTRLGWVLSGSISQ